MQDWEAIPVEVRQLYSILTKQLNKKQLEYLGVISII